MKMQFEAFEGGNVLWGEDDHVRIRATVEVPNGASEDYGYLALKEAVIELVAGYADNIIFPYDYVEDRLEEDAREGGADLGIEAQTKDGWDIFEGYGLLEWLEPEEFHAGPWMLYDRAVSQDGEEFDILLKRDLMQMRYSAV